MHDFVLNKSPECVQNLDKDLDALLLGESLLALKVLREISFVAVLQDEVEIIGCLFDVVELNDVFIVASPQHLDLVLE